MFPSVVRAVFSGSGSLAAALPGYEQRPEQAALADAVEKALSTGEHLIAEAGTGTGKSLAYLVPALESGQRVVVATATKALQEQLLRSDVPLAEAALGRRLDVAVLKGRQNYLCRRAVHGFELLGSALFDRPEDGRAFERLRPWIDATETGDRAELDFEPPVAVWDEIAVGSDRCVGRKCPLLGSCFSERARARAAEADLVIVNHALYFADLGLRDDGGAVLPEHDAVVFDEAHRLEESAAAWLGGRVGTAAVARLARDVDRACREAGRPVPAHQLDRAERSVTAVVARVCPPTGRRRLREAPADDLLRLEGALVDLADSLAGGGEELDGLRRRALGLAAEAGVCLEVEGLDRVVWAEPGAVAWAPVDVSDELRTQLWQDGPTAVLVSATLTAAGEFGFVRRRLGLDHARELRLESPFDYGTQTLLYVPRHLPDPRAEPYDEVAEEVVALCRASRGRALVLTSSYRALDALATRIRGRLPYPLHVQGEAPRERLLERFRSEVSSILLATGTFWQGVDVRGESLSLLVIDKLPFGSPGDPLVEARCERLAADGLDPFFSYSLPSAVLQLRQGFGRLVRSHADRGVVAILDPRMRTRRYGSAFLASLPVCPVTDDRADVGRFFAAAERLTA
jgi:ATP-dependent DNA helicase DinG